MDLVIARENTEGFYADRNMAWGIGEFMPTPDVALAVGKITRQGSERIARTAFALARQRRQKVAIVHKANVLRKTTGLFLEVCRGVGAGFPDVAVEDYHIDAMTALLVRRGADFDVIVTENMFGDILSDLTGELSGSLGMAPSINASDKHAMAQASHGSAPDIAGKGVANPVGMILSGAMLLVWLSGAQKDPAAGEAGHAIQRAVAAVLEKGPRTRDLGGTASTSEFTAAVVRRLLSD
jgi:3-isopropylmalate dehydrogenase